MKNLATSVGSALCVLATVAGTGGAVAAVGAGSAHAVTTSAALPDLTVSNLPGVPGYTLLPTCAPGLKAIVFHIMVSNIGAGPAAPIGNVHAVWVVDTVKPAWAGGAPIPAAIAAHANTLVDVSLSALSPPSAMWGAHTFKVTVNGPKFIAESSYSNNEMTIPVIIPKGFCAPSNPVSIAVNPNINVVTPAPSPKPTFNPGVAMAPALAVPTPFPPPINLAQAFTKEVCQAHGGSAGSFACYIGLPAGKIALVWDYPTGPVDGYNVYRADLAPPGPMSVHTLSAPKPIASQSDPSWKFVVLDAQKAGSCFAVTAYHGSDESARSVRLCIGNGGVPKQATLQPDRVGTMVADFFYDPHVEVTKQNGTPPFIRDLLYITVGYKHLATLWRDQARTDVAQYTNSLFRGYAHFNTSALSGHQIAQAQLSLPGGSTQGGASGQLCLANYGAADHLWNPGGNLSSTSQMGNGPYQGPDLHLDVTALVQSWANSPGSNYGITMDGEQRMDISKMLILATTCLTSFPTATLDVTYY